MLKQAQLPNYTGDARDWTPILRRYQESDHGRAVLEVMITAVPFVLLSTLMWASLGLSYWLTLTIAVPAAGFLMRLFMIQHDCGHGSFFRRRCANDWLGRAIAVPVGSHCFRVLAACAWRFGISAGAIDILPRIAGFAACAAEESLSKSGAHL